MQISTATTCVGTANTGSRSISPTTRQRVTLNMAFTTMASKGAIRNIGGRQRPFGQRIGSAVHDQPPPGLVAAWISKSTSDGALKTRITPSNNEDRRPAVEQVDHHAEARREQWQ